MKEDSRTLGWICPQCGQSVVVSRSVFSLAASPSRIPCPCGKSEVTVVPGEEDFQITVPCLSCGREHTVSCSAHALLERRAIILSCSASGMPCFCAGEEGAVYEAVSRMEETADLLPSGEEEEKRPFLNSVVMEEVLGELRDIAARPNGITCTCGGTGICLKVGRAAVEVLCKSCGGAVRIPAATERDLEDLCCKARLVIRGI